MPVFDHFDFLAPYYERVISFDALEMLIRTVALPVDGLLLDAGGGTGRVAAAARPYARAVIVADLSPGMLRESRAKDLPALLAPTERLPFANGAFTRIIMVDALHHVIHQQETARELWRALQPGGRLVIVEPDLRKFSVKLIAIAEKLALMRSHFLSPEQISALFEETNAHVDVQREGINAWVVVDKPQQA